MRRCLSLLLVAVLAITLLAFSGTAQAQFGSLKDKVKRKANEKVDKKLDDALDGKDNKSSDDKEKGKEGSEKSGQEKASSTGKEAAASPAEMSLYTKYDFIPGDKVIFFDDLAREETGEFPSRWKLDVGVFEVAKLGDRPWIMCTNRGVIRPKVAPGPLPPKYTFELDFYVKGQGHATHSFFIYWYDSKDRSAGSNNVGQFGIIQDYRTFLDIKGSHLANKALDNKLSPGVHTMRVMATTTSLKCYIDNVRMANVPAVEGFTPNAIAVFMDPQGKADNPQLIGNIRYAEGGKTLREQLDEAGRIVTHGILFASGSAVIRGESYKTLADIGKLLTDSPDLRLSIEGHTDSDGADASNLTLSKNRAESVKAYLVENATVDAGRLETKGWGKTKPIDKNTTPEGKANNRRVELVKL